ncbi:MAG: MaoC family dehydratase [Gammaproteobacteria bacterium]|nr:MaoC family dehydratase [Gammaproteobacteria bacterium]MCP5423516.1 MaoC family dehydratase [Gammaproteobacteria bacterium]
MGIAGYSLATLQNFVGLELGVSEWVAIDQARIDEFAECTNDHQWIHVDVERARRESPFGETIAHGYLTLSLLSPLQNAVGVVPDDAHQAINYGLDRVRFMTPVKAGARVRMHVAIVSAEDRGKGRILLKTRNTFEIEGEDKPALVAESLAFLR